MENPQQEKFADYGPYSHWNWREQIAKQELPRYGYAAEIQLFSDAHFIGTNIKHGPYTVMNAQSLGKKSESTYARLVLRYEQYLDQNQDPTVSYKETTDTSRYHGGDSIEEIASLYSLCWGIRLKAGGLVREFAYWNGYGEYGEPRTPTTNEIPIFPSPQDRKDILPWHSGERKLNAIEEQINSYISLTPNQASELIRSARLYQDAVWVSESSPEISWLLLVSAVEVAANYWYPKEKISDDLVEQLKHFKPELFKDLEKLEDTGAKAIEIVSQHLEGELKSTKKFMKFLLTFKPKSPPTDRPLSYQVKWSGTSMEKIFNKIYTYRSCALHGGTPFPKSMCIPPVLDWENKIPYELPDVGLAHSTLGGFWKAEDLPAHLHIFEYIVRQALLNWWNSMIESNSKSDDQVAE
jgi:hypothetical protein